MAVLSLSEFMDRVLTHDDISEELVTFVSNAGRSNLGF